MWSLDVLKNQFESACWPSPVCCSSPFSHTDKNRKAFKKKAHYVLIHFDGALQRMSLLDFGLTKMNHEIMNHEKWHGRCSECTPICMQESSENSNKTIGEDDTDRCFIQQQRKALVLSETHAWTNPRWENQKHTSLDTASSSWQPHKSWIKMSVFRRGADARSGNRAQVRPGHQARLFRSSSSFSRR